MVLSDIRTWVRNKLGDSAFDTDIIDTSANWFVNELFMNTRTRQMETSDEMFVSAGDTTTDFPDDIQTLINLYSVSPNIIDLSTLYTEYGAFMKFYPNFAQQTANPITAWTDFGNAMRFSAPLKADTTILVDYLRTPVLMVAADDECEVKDLYQELVVLGTVKRCMEANEDYAEASQELANLEPLRTAFIRNEGRGQLKIGPTVMRTNRRGGGSRFRDPYGSV